MKVRNCRHGFNPVDGPGLWCPACEAEERDPSLLPWWLRLLRRIGLW